MLASADSSPPREISDSPGPSTFPVELLSVPPSNPRKRKSDQSTLSNSSPAPPDTPNTADPSTPAAAALVLPNRNDLSSRPRLHLSRFPTFPSDGLNDYHTTDQLAMNRIGFRYYPAGISAPGSALPCRTIESSPQSYRVAWEDRSPFVKVTSDGLGLEGDKGFRSARSNAPVREGKWYMEVRVEQGGGDYSQGEENMNPNKLKKEGSHVRLGWGRREAPLNGPVGLDGYSYGIRDKTGDKTTLSRPRPYGRAFGSGDVIGMYISLPKRRAADREDPEDPAHIKRERIAIEFKGQEYFECLEYPPTKEMISLVDYSGKAAGATSVPGAPTTGAGKKSATAKSLPDRGLRGKNAASEPAPLRPLPTLGPDSRMAFFVNGECQGIAFQDIYDYLPLHADAASRRKGKDKQGSRRNKEGAREHKENPFDDGTLGYYPFISLFNDARVRMNPGPDFEFPPTNDIDALLTGEAMETAQEQERTWRPISERYPEFMAEQWALDEEDEAQAEVEVAERVEQDKAEAQKQAQREKRKQQAEARKRSKKAQIQGVEIDHVRVGSPLGRSTAQPRSSVGTPREGSQQPTERYTQPHPLSSLAIPSTAQQGYTYGRGPYSPALSGAEGDGRVSGSNSGTHSGENTPGGTPNPNGLLGGGIYRHEPMQFQQFQPRLQEWTEFDLRAM